MLEGQFPIDVHEDLDAGELSGKPLIETIRPGLGVQTPIVQEYSCSLWPFSSRIYDHHGDHHYCRAHRWKGIEVGASDAVSLRRGVQQVLFLEAFLHDPHLTGQIITHERNVRRAMRRTLLRASAERAFSRG